MLPNVPTPINTRRIEAGNPPGKSNAVSIGNTGQNGSTLTLNNQTTLIDIRPFATVSDKISVLTPLKPGHMIVRDFSNITDGNEPTGKLQRNESGGRDQTKRPLNHGE
jgi:hypothetical protein